MPLNCWLDHYFVIECMNHYLIINKAKSIKYMKSFDSLWSSSFKWKNCISHLSICMGLGRSVHKHILLRRLLQISLYYSLCYKHYKAQTILKYMHLTLIQRKDLMLDQSSQNNILLVMSIQKHPYWCYLKRTNYKKCRVLVPRTSISK